MTEEEIKPLVSALTGCRDMLRECAKQHRQRGDNGHANVADSHADRATDALRAVETKKLQALTAGGAS